jgi:carbohydrate-selective porin OprB
MTKRALPFLVLTFFVGWGVAVGATPDLAVGPAPSEAPAPEARRAFFPIHVYGSFVRNFGELLAGTAGTIAGPRRAALEKDRSSPFLDWWNGPHMLGGTGQFGPQIRQRLKACGLTFDANYQGALFGVVDSQGGSRGFWNEQLTVSSALNLGRLLENSTLQGTTLFGSIRYRDSWPESNPNEFVEANGMFNPSNWQSGAQFRVLNFGVEFDSAEFLPLEHMLVVRAGWLQPQKEFIDQPLSKLFLNNAINSAKGVGGNIPFSSSFSTWGGTITFRPLPNWYYKQGLFMSFPQATASGNHGMAFEGFAQDPSRNGLFAMGEAGFTPKIGSQQMPGKYAFGWYYYGLPGQQAKSWNGTPVSGQYGFYFQADQMLHRESVAVAPETASFGKSILPSKKTVAPTESPLSDQGLKTFNLLTFAPGYARANVFPFYFQSGLVYTGLIPTRDRDLTMVAFGYGAYQRGVVHPDRTYSAVLEGGYRFQINGWSYAQPFFQYILRPDGTRQVQNATILGFMVGAVF